MSPLAHAVMRRAACYVYDDLIAAEAYLRGYETHGEGNRDRLFELCFVKPGGLWQVEKQGHVISEERSLTFTSFEDVAGGMCEIARGFAEERENRWVGGEVSVKLCC